MAQVQEVDVLICGSGSAGLCAATWLARCGVRCRVLEARGGPLEVGQADGVQCRTVEIMESFGIVDGLLREAYHVLETVFWSAAGADGKLVRTRRTADTAPGLSHQPHVILNQARMHSFLVDAMRRFNGQEIDYGYRVKSVSVDKSLVDDPAAHPVTVVAEHEGREEVFKAKYALGCDGAHSTVRKSLGFKMVGDSTDSIWGVMDIYPRTDFPDIRKKAALQSKSGSLLIIPREGGSLVRLYIELPHESKDVKLEDLHAAAQRIFFPYKLEIADTFWWSAYSIGQRLADHFSESNRVFLTGDACHTHSPKAGQGMNTSLQDGYNIGWKLAMVLKNQASPSLLKTYNLEREKVAADLISFDRDFAKLFSSSKAGSELNAVSQAFSEAFIKSAQYMAGLTARYAESPITNYKGAQDAAAAIEVGKRFPTAQVVRFADAKAIQLVTALPADGRWRIVAFLGDIREPAAADRMKKLGDFLSSESGPIRKYTSASADIDSFIETLIVLHGPRISIEQEQIPDYFWPVTGKWRMRDLHKIFFDDQSYNSGHGHAYQTYGVDPKRGCLAIVRPDQYVSMVTDVEDWEGVQGFFDGCATKATAVI